MQTDPKPLHDYVRAIEKDFARGISTEASYYSYLKELLQSLGKDVTATSNPRRIECGAPDFVITKGWATIGYIEAKDMGESLDLAERSEQLQRYRGSLSNLALTDYLEFRWYTDGELRAKERLGTVTRDGRVRRDRAGGEAVCKLLADFLAHAAEPVGTPKDLALRMARLAHMIRDLIVAAIEKEPDSGALHAQFSAFRDNLIPGLSTEQFADMYAQTIAYGLFAARCTTDTGTAFTRLDAAQNLPRTNPFLRKLFQHIAGYDLDDRIAWLVDDLAQLIAQADMEAVLEGFGKRAKQEDLDPVVYFYEDFLREYDPTTKTRRDVYYTPLPVVSYIVRSIHHLLRMRFARPEGLADTNTLILDPAVGTGTFLYSVVKEIHDALRGQEGAWDNYVAEHLLSRLFGFEVLMAPYAIAHLKLSMLLQETGYQFQSEQRLGIYLTNTLEEAIRRSETLFASWITEEANAAAEIKKGRPIMVVLGNPPYSLKSANLGPTARQSIEPYRYVDGARIRERGALQFEKNLQDDYVKFIRFGQWRIERTGQGILSLITNHAYLDNPTLRGMRQSLINSFTDIYIVDLHGNAKRKETTPSGGKDENVFDIQQGVAIAIFVKELGSTAPARVHHADLWGLRDDKYHAISEMDVRTTTWTKLQPHSPSYLFVPREESLAQEYEQGWAVPSFIHSYSAGIVTARDHFVIDFAGDALLRRVRQFQSSTEGDHELCERLGIARKKGWDIARARKLIKAESDLSTYIRSLYYRPFDIRQIFYHRSLVWGMSYPVMRHMRLQNKGLIWTRPMSPNYEFSVLTTRLLADQCAVGNKSAGAGISYLGPLYLYPTEQEIIGGLYKPNERRPNLAPDFVNALSELGLRFVVDGKGDLEETIGPEDVFNYAYAIFHSPTYRSRYREFLKGDFPRLPLTSNRKLFAALAEKGAELVSLHVMESPALNNLITTYPGPGLNVVDKVTYNERDCRLHINKSQYFEGVPPEVWNFCVGGYQVCEKWLKDRTGRALTFDDLLHYQKVVVALKETICLMREIDALIPGWPLE